MSRSLGRSSEQGADPSLPREAWERLERILECFEGAWQRGERPTLDDYLVGGPAERRALLIELVHEDLELRLRLGEPARVEAYLERYPELAEGRPAVLELIAAEYRLRRRREPNLSPEEYARRFPQYAAELAGYRDGPGEAGAAAGGGETAVSLGGRSVAGGRVDIPGYNILVELGRGGMGVVYKAQQLGLNRTVALKMILSGVYAGAAELARFQFEAEAIARLKHPNIVQIHEIGEMREGLPYFSLEFCEGASLDKKLNGTPLPPREAAELVRLLARAMHSAHQAGVVHRDLKPANVLLTADGQPKITDFGLAKRLNDATGRTASGAVLGTPSYMAPEQAGGKSREIGPAADVYALGAILYELLTGRPPFKAATAAETVMQVMIEPPVAPSVLQRKTPRDLETICLKCLEKNSPRRYSSAAELAADLDRYLKREPIHARRATFFVRFHYWLRRPERIRDAGIVHLALVLLTVAFLIQALFADALLMLDGYGPRGTGLGRNLAIAGGILVIEAVEIWLALKTISRRWWAIYLGLLLWSLKLGIPMISMISSNGRGALIQTPIAFITSLGFFAYVAALYAYLVNREEFRSEGRRSQPRRNPEPSPR